MDAPHGESVPAGEGGGQPPHLLLGDAEPRAGRPDGARVGHDGSPAHSLAQGQQLLTSWHGVGCLNIYISLSQHLTTRKQPLNGFCLFFVEISFTNLCCYQLLIHIVLPAHSEKGI